MNVALRSSLAALVGNDPLAILNIDILAIATEPMASVTAGILASVDRRALSPIGLRSPQSGTVSFVGFTIPGKGDHRVQLLVGRSVSLQVLSTDKLLHQRVSQHFDVTMPSDAVVPTALGPVQGHFGRSANHYVSGDWSLSKSGITLQPEQAAVAAAIKTQIAVGVLNTVYPKLLALL